MKMQFDPDTGNIIFDGKNVGQHSYRDGRSCVELNIKFETDGEWIVPLCWLAYGFGLLDQVSNGGESMDISSPEESVQEEFDAQQFLIEKQIKRDGFVWTFHKSDLDDWPSPLHGHDYDRALKLDAITGDVYVATTKALCKKLKNKHLLDIQNSLRQSKDFKDKVEKFIDCPSGIKNK